MKLMQHPVHGLHNVYTELEEKAMVANGWTEADGDKIPENELSRKRERPIKERI